MNNLEFSARDLREYTQEKKKMYLSTSEEACLQVIFDKIKLAATLGFDETRVQVTPEYYPHRTMKKLMETLRKRGFRVKALDTYELLIRWN